MNQHIQYNNPRASEALTKKATEVAIMAITKIVTIATTIFTAIIINIPVMTPTTTTTTIPTHPINNMHIGRMPSYTSETASTTSPTPLSIHLEPEQRHLSLSATFAIPNTEFQSVKDEEPSRVSSEGARLTEQSNIQTAYLSITSRSTSEYPLQTSAIDFIRVNQAKTPTDTGDSSVENGHHPPAEHCYESTVSDDKALANMMATHFRATTAFKNACRPTIKPQVPMTGLNDITSTPQLVYCITLLLNNSESVLHGESVKRPVDLSKREGRWLRGAREDPEIQKYLCSLTSMMVWAFVDARSQCPDLTAEIVLLGPVLNRDDYHTLLSHFIKSLNHARWQNIEYLRGMIRLVQSASPGVLADDDVDKILTAIRVHLGITTKDYHHLVFAATKVLGVMASGIAKDLDRQRDYRPLLDVLHATSCKDRSLEFQVECARQACLYLSADETPLRKVLCSAHLATTDVPMIDEVSTLDVQSVIAAVEHLRHVSSTSAIDVDVVITEVNRARAGVIAGSDAKVVKEAGHIRQKEAWYPALQAAETFVQHGRLVEFSQLVCDASCRYDLNFQRGACQIIGEIAIDPLWTVASRRSAIDCLLGLYHLHGADIDFDTGHNIRPSIVAILRHISNMKQSDIKKYASTLLSDLPGKDSCNLQIFHPWMTRLPLPPFYRLLRRAQAIPQEETQLRYLRRMRLQECLQPIYVTLQATSSCGASRDTPCSLITTMQGFLKSDRLVYLLLGESGSGKTSSCRRLERELWDDYNNGGMIPIYIDLSYIDTPEHKLIETQLHTHGFSDDEIQQLLQHRQFVIICDGYDVRRLTTNLFKTNQLGQWDVKMIINCRSTFLPSDYQGRFRPHGPDHYFDKSANLYEESTIASLSESDIKEFIQQYVRDLPAQEPLGRLHLSIADDYWNALAAIPNMVNVVENPFLLTLALRNLPSLSHDALDPARRETTRDQLYNNFVNSWIDANKKRLDSTILSQESSDAYDLLCDPNFRWCVRDFLKRFATAMRKHQKNRLVVKYTEREDKNSWKAEFLGRAIEATLLREASPLTKTGNHHRFLYDSLFVFFRFLAAYDPFEDDDSPNNNDDDDSFDGQDGFHDDGDLTDGNTGSSGGSDGSADDNNRSTGDSDRSSGGSDSPTDGNDNPTGGNDGSTGGNDGPTGGNDGSTGGNYSSTGGSDDPTGDRVDFGDSHGGTRNGSSSGGGKDASEEDKGGSRRSKDVSRSKKKSRSNKPLLSTLFSDVNYLDDLEVLELLVERAQVDSRMRKCLFTVIEQSKLSTAPSLAAANSITILFKAGERFLNIDLNDVRIPGNYILREALEFMETDLVHMLCRLAMPILKHSTTTIMTPLADVNFDPTTHGPIAPPPTLVILESQQQIGSEYTSKMTALADVNFDPTTHGPIAPPPTLVILESQQQIGSEDTSKMTVSARHLQHHALVPEFVSEYTLGDELGYGGSSIVVSATRNSDQKEVAVKFIFREKVTVHGWVKDPELGVIPVEIYILRNVAHANIIGFLNVYQDHKYFYLVMEMHGTPWSAINPLLNNMQGSMMGTVVQATINQRNVAVAAVDPSATRSTSTISSGSYQDISISSSSSSLYQATGSSDKAHQPANSALLAHRASCDLFACVEYHSRFTETQARVIFKQIVECVHYLNSRGICHRDIKDENFVIDNDLRVKLIDFGSAVIIPKPQGKLFDRYYGTIDYASPEILRGEKYRAEAAEIWSLGILFYIILYGEVPFSDPVQAISGPYTLPRVRSSGECLHLLNWMLAKKPERRATIEDVANHPWIVGVSIPNVS
ncbi:hypothetical protein KI688_005902 [Linnemannia hyalina]|uniref:Protein kinase domain-containing protein n=1 Tax=Linnemannia hyalina TaxID=64524 RepID=A0A9P7Y1R5_9FUNG|nr:hypothetical protein KI688_005902 [Linnemannia hyalina]